MIKEFKGEYRWLSNFAPVKITLNGINYSSVEHAYMSAKSDSKEWKDYCSDIHHSAWEVKRQSRTIKLKENWEIIKLEIMKECLIQKFSYEPYHSLLISTGTQHLQEGNHWNDKFWGVCLKTNTGENNLGKLIMEIRNTKLLNI